MSYKLIFTTALPFPNQISSSLSNPLLWQWRMAAITCLSPLHGFLWPLLNNTHSQTVARHPSFFVSSKTPCFLFWSFLAPRLHPSAILCIPLPHFFPFFLQFHGDSLQSKCLVLFWHSTLIPFLLVLSIHSGWLKRRDNDRGMTEEWWYQKDEWAYSTHDWCTKRLCGRSFIPCLERESECAYMCWPPIIVIVWEDCFGALLVVSACECSHPISRACVVNRACKETLAWLKSYLCVHESLPVEPEYFQIRQCVYRQLCKLFSRCSCDWLSSVFDWSFVVYLFTLQSHLWITVLVISGFGGLIQIPLFVNIATSPKSI